MRELSNKSKFNWKGDLVKEMVEGARDKDTVLKFALVYSNTSGYWRLREIGTVHSTKKGPDDMKPLSKFSFRIGDYIDLAITKEVPVSAATNQSGSGKENK